MAQDYLTITQPKGPVFEHLEVFSMLGETTIIILERLLNLGELAVKPFGWGIYGLSSGYVSSDPLFNSYKQQLYVAVDSLSTLCSKSDSSSGRNFIKKGQTGHIFALSIANRQVHLSATMLLQIMRKDWGRLRWYHGIQVARHWIDYLGIEEFKKEGEDFEEGEVRLLQAPAFSSGVKIHQGSV